MLKPYFLFIPGIDVHRGHPLSWNCIGIVLTPTCKHDTGTPRGAPNVRWQRDVHKHFFSQRPWHRNGTRRLTLDCQVFRHWHQPVHDQVWSLTHFLSLANQGSVWKSGFFFTKRESCSLGCLGPRCLPPHTVVEGSWRPICQLKNGFRTIPW